MSTDMGQQETTGWVGWIAFASSMMIIGGILSMIYGLIAAVNDEWVVFGNRADVYLDLSAWGWVHMLVGLLVFLCGIGLLSGKVFARTIGVIIAGISLIANFLIIPVYPFWAITIITINALVIWALTAHGHELKTR